MENKNVQKWYIIAILVLGGIAMECSLRAQLKIIKLMDLKPNFSDLARQYGFDRRTVKSIMKAMKESLRLETKLVSWINTKMK